MRLKAIKISLLSFLMLVVLFSMMSCGKTTLQILTLPPGATTVTAPPVTVTSTVPPTTFTISDATVTVTSKPTTTATIITTIVVTTPPATGSITITGYLTTEDDFAAKLGADTAGMVYMRMMAASGLGITRQKSDGSWEFYYFSGTITSGMKVNNAWTFNGTGDQLSAWNLCGQVAAVTPSANVPITITGILKGDTATNPGSDADGLYFPVITVSSFRLN